MAESRDSDSIEKMDNNYGKIKGIMLDVLEKLRILVLLISKLDIDLVISQKVLQLMMITCHILAQIFVVYSHSYSNIGIYFLENGDLMATEINMIIILMLTLILASFYFLY